MRREDAVRLGAAEAAVLQRTLARRTCEAALTVAAVFLVLGSLLEEGDGGGGRAAEALAEANDDGALMRFEFLEAVSRLAVLRYVAPGECGDVSEAIERLLRDCVGPCLCPEAALVRDDFRSKRLYREEVCALLRSHLPVLKAVYSLYRAKARAALLPMEQWLLFCNQSELAGPKTGVSIREAKLVFLFSQMTVVDEIKHRDRLVSLTFFDFMEALGRMADLISPPDAEGLDAYFSKNKPRGDHSLGRVWEYYERVPADRAEKERRESAGLMEEDTRPLGEKLGATLELALGNLCQNIGAESHKALAKECLQLTKLAGGAPYKSG